MFDSERADIPGSLPAGPLSGIKVLDLSTYLAGPYGCALLGDLGAQVIKIEPPAGDNFRHYPSTLPGASRAFLGINRSKLSVVLDLKREACLEAFYRLVRQADVVVENFRPSVTRRLKIDYETLRTINGEIVYGSLTGYGERGPLSGNAGYDQVLQSMTGICSLQTDSEKRPQIVRGSVVDYYASALLSQGVLAALFHRERSGKGQHVSVSLLRSALAMQSARFVWADSEGADVDRDLRAGGVTGIHPTKEGLLYISAPTSTFWNALCGATGLEDMARDPRFQSLKGRAQHTPEILARLHAALSTRTAKEWEAVFGDTVPNAAVRRIEEMFEHPQVLAEDLVGHFQHSEIGGYRAFKHPVELSATPGPEPFAAPTIGQHTRRVLAGLGYNDDEIAAITAV